MGTQLGSRSTDIEIENSTSLPNNEIHDSPRQRFVPNFIPEDFHMREPRITAGYSYHQSGAPEAETMNLSHSTGRRPGYSKRSESDKSSRSFSPLDTIPSGTSDSNSLQQRSHRSNFPSIAARPNESIQYPDKIQLRKVPENNILQEPRLPHEKVTGWHDVEGRPGYPASDGQSQQFPSISTAPELHDMTQDIDWQALNQTLDHMIEEIYANGARNRASYSQKMADPNLNATKVAADESAEEEDASLVSSDESDLTDSDDLDEDRVYNHMENSSTLPGVNIDITEPYVEDSMSANVGRLHLKSSVLTYTLNATPQR